jgi:hypothetical protein
MKKQDLARQSMNMASRADADGFHALAKVLRTIGGGNWTKAAPQEPQEMQLDGRQARNEAAA